MDRTFLNKITIIEATVAVIIITTPAMVIIMNDCAAVAGKEKVIMEIIIMHINVSS